MMKITFLMPCYPWAPMGGFKVVYEYANQFANRGHEVTVVHAREVKFGPPKRRSLYEKLRDIRTTVVVGNSIPEINWHTIDPRVKLLFVPNADSGHIPDGDAVFATACSTAPPVLQYPASKGSKFYLIQHYETFMGPKDLLDQTWRSPLHKVVISKWLLSVGKELGVTDLAYIPNAIDHDHYRLTTPMQHRKKQVAMIFSHVPFKGSKDGIAAIEIAKKKHPDLDVVFFGTGRHAGWIPKWIPYYRNPPQDFIVDEIYNKSKVFLSPSLSEGFALPPAEAACCGCAIVATDSGGIADFVEDGITGLLSPPADPKALGENLCRVLDDEQLRVSLAVAAARQLMTFTWKKNAQLMETFITSSRKMEQLEGIIPMATQQFPVPI
jgi:glycosyltransferase involved in cell wall biosynthesis